MVKSKLWSLLATLALVFSVVVLAPPFVRTASAAAALTSLTPGAGVVGSSVRVIGTINPSSTFEIRWNSAVGTILASGTSAAGTGAVDRVVIVPATPASVAYAIFLVDLSDATNVSLPFTVTPNLIISPITGPVGSVVSVIGTGFQSLELSIAVTFAPVGVVVTTPAAPVVNAVGSWAATFVVPAVLGGPHTVDASGATTLAASVPDRTFTTPDIPLSTNAAPVGTVVTVNGVGFQPGESGIRVTWDGSARPTTPATITANAAGAWSATFVVPTATLAVHTVDAAGAITTVAQVTDQLFTVIAGIAVSPTSGPPGTTVTVTGTGFAANEPNIVLTFNAVLVRPLFSASAAGSWTTTFVAPTIPAAAGNVVDATGPTSTFWTTFNVTPGLGISPASGPGGTVVTVTGTGFQFGDAIAVTFDGAPIATVPVAPLVSAAGSWSAAIIVPLGATGGAHIIDALGAPGTLAAAVPDQTFTVIGLTIAPDTGPVGTTVTVNGVGFAAGETGIQVTWDGVAVRTGILANAAGAWSTTFVVPAAARGAHTVDAQGTTTTAATVPDQAFTVTPQVNVTGSGSRPGETVTVTGTGFGAAEAGIVVTWDGAAALTVGSANSNGGWSGTLTIPNAFWGTHNINAFGNATPAGTAANVSQFVGHAFSIAPTSGVVGTSVTVNGSGFYANETGIQALFNGTAVGSGITAGANGTWSTTFTIPATARGSYLVNARGNTTTTSQVPGKTFVLAPTVSISPTSGYAGQVVSVNGAGFAGSSVVSITYDGAAVSTTPASIVSTATGNVSASFTVPSSAPGAHTVAFNDGAGTINATLTVTSSVSSTTTSGTVGAQTTINGLGFPANSAVAFTFDNATVTATPVSVTTSASGAFTASLTIPDAARGTHTIKAASGSTVLSMSFEVSPKLSVSPDSGAVGASVTLTGKGFGGGEPIAFTIDGVAVTSTPATVSASANGNFSATIALPALAGGPHVIKAADRAASAQVAVTVTTLTVSPDNGNVGSMITISGAGYAAGSAISITYDGAPIAATPSPLTATSGGSFQATVTIPRSLHGQHVFAASDAAGRNAQASFTMEATPPAAPAPLSPPTGTRLGTFGAEKPAFYWGPVSDPSGVTYTLQVSKESTFTPVAVEKKGLADISYQLAENEKLGRGYYYWRVKATDGASNESDWSQTFVLKIGILPTWMPMWMLIAFIVIGLGIVAGLVYLLGFSSRTNRI